MTARTTLLSSDNVRHSDRPVMVGGPARLPEHIEHDATVTSVRDEAGDVREIHVTCGCGRVTVISCEYPRTGT